MTFQTIQTPVFKLFIMKHFTLIVFFCSQIIFAQYEWNYVGEAGFSAGSVSFVDVELDIGGMPYVIFTDAGDNNEQKTYRFYQESWVGAGGGTNPPHLHNSLAIGANNYPLISSFGESFAELEVYFIVSINSQTGTIVQGANYPTNSGNPITGCTMNSVMVYDNGVAYVAHGTSSNSINVWKNNNYLSTSSNWSSEQVIGGGGSLGFSYDVKFGKSVTAWSRANNSGKLSISLDDYGINNDEITFDGLSDSNAIDIAVEVSDNLEYFVAFKDVANGGKASVLKFDGVDTWNYLGGAGFTSSQASFIDITTDISGTPYIVYQDASAAGRLSVQKYNQANDEWEFIGQEGFTNGVGSYCKIEIDNSNRPIVAFSDSSVNNFASVIRAEEVLSDDDQQIKQFAIAPVPTDNILKIQGTQGSVSVKVFDLSGRLIMQGTTYGELNVSGLNSGVYSIIIGNDLYTETHKFIKQ
jgi:hypothetical protein